MTLIPKVAPRTVRDVDTSDLHDTAAVRAKSIASRFAIDERRITRIVETLELASPHYGDEQKGNLPLAVAESIVSAILEEGSADDGVKLLESQEGTTTLRRFESYEILRLEQVWTTEDMIVGVRRLLDQMHAHRDELIQHGLPTGEWAGPFARWLAPLLPLPRDAETSPLYDEELFHATFWNPECFQNAFWQPENDDLRSAIRTRVFDVKVTVIESLARSSPRADADDLWSAAQASVRRTLTREDAIELLIVEGTLQEPSLDRFSILDVMAHGANLGGLSSAIAFAVTFLAEFASGWRDWLAIELRSRGIERQSPPLRSFAAANVAAGPLLDQLAERRSHRDRELISRGDQLAAFLRSGLQVLVRSEHRVDADARAEYVRDLERFNRDWRPSAARAGPRTLRLIKTRTAWRVEDGTETADELDCTGFQTIRALLISPGRRIANEDLDRLHRELEGRGSRERSDADPHAENLSLMTGAGAPRRAKVDETKRSFKKVLQAAQDRAAMARATGNSRATETASREIAELVAWAAKAKQAGVSSDVADPGRQIQQRVRGRIVRAVAQLRERGMQFAADSLQNSITYAGTWSYDPTSACEWVVTDLR